MVKSGENRSGMRSLWLFFASVKLSVFVLSLLALTSILGTVIPQNIPPEQLQEAFGSAGVAFLNAFHLTDMYHSWWFRLLMGGLAVNLLVCSLERLRSQRKILFGPPVLRSDRFRNAKFWGEFGVEREAESVAKDLAGSIGQPILQNSNPDAAVMVWERGRWTRFGVYIVHASVLLLLAGGLFGSIAGFQGRMRIPEGESRNVVILEGGGELSLGFDIRCDRFQVKFHESGMPDEYRSTLTLLSGGNELMTRDILVNKPLSYGGVRLFQATYGAVPATEVTIGITDSSGMLTRPEKVRIGETLSLGEGRTLIVETFIPGFHLRGHNLGDALICRVEEPGNPPDQLVLPVQFPGFDKMRKGAEVFSVLDYEKRYYTGLEVTRDPGVPVVYAGFLLLIVGCWVTFFMGHQRFCIEVRSEGGKSCVRVMGITDRNRLGFRRVLTRMTMRLAGELDAGDPDVSRLSGMS